MYFLARVLSKRVRSLEYELAYLLICWLVMVLVQIVLTLQVFLLLSATLTLLSLSQCTLIFDEWRELVLLQTVLLLYVGRLQFF